jgi:hypothetical protein
MGCSQRPSGETVLALGLWVAFAKRGPYAAHDVGYDYGLTVPKVQMFVPLAVEGRSFDFVGAVRFRLARYASILAFNGDFRPENAALGWQKYPLSDRNRRWFVLGARPNRHRGRAFVAR